MTGRLVDGSAVELVGTAADDDDISVALLLLLDGVLGSGELDVAAEPELELSEEVVVEDGGGAELEVCAGLLLSLDEDMDPLWP